MTIEVTKNTYEKDGKSYVRVTRVLDIIAKPEFYRWYAKFGWEHCIRVRDDRAAFGTRIHKEIQNWLEDKNIWIDNKEMSETMDLFKDWCVLHDVVPEKLELHLFNDEMGVAGTCDFFGRFDGKDMIIDWKTSKKIYDNYRLQVAAYLYMFEQAYNRELDGAGIVCFRDGKVVEEFLSRDECLGLVSVFKNARELYRWKHGK